MGAAGRVRRWPSSNRSAFLIRAARTRCYCWSAIERPDAAILCAVLATAGSLLGSLIFYQIVRKGGDKFLLRYTLSGRGQRFKAWVHRYGMVTVFISALLPIPFLPLKVFCGLRLRDGREPHAFHAGAGRGADSALCRLSPTWARN